MLFLEQMFISPFGLITFMMVQTLSIIMTFLFIFYSFTFNFIHFLSLSASFVLSYVLISDLPYDSSFFFPMDSLWLENIISFCFSVKGFLFWVKLCASSLIVISKISFNGEQGPGNCGTSGEMPNF